MDQNSSGLQSKGTVAPDSTQNETQDSLKVTSSLPDATQGQQVNIQAPVPIIHTRGPNIQEPSTSTPMTRRVSIQEPPASVFLPRKLSVQSSPRRLSTQETRSQGFQSNTQDIQSVAYNRWLSSREGSALYHNRLLDILNSHTLCSVQPETHNLQTDSHLSLTLSHNLKRETRASVDIPPSITHSPEASIRSFESFVWDSKDDSGGLPHYSLSSQSTLGSSFKLSSNSTALGSSRKQSKRWSLVPISWKLLLEAKKITRYLSLVLTVAGMLMLNLIALWQPWIHFQVPLSPTGSTNSSKSIPIDTIFFMRCPDISCMNEYDKNAYLLDLAWACLLISGIMSFCVCMGLISTIFFPSTNMPLMDFSLFICSLMTGLFSYLNYMNFWSILAVQAIWS
ncbi:uncharacterized protein LOC130869009 isoform X2 [Chionomys nivalis]|uniref:uncharacterized protein LOC130869009 isoform X2 n=1 Tax=Chionomys nivalis TaxID=269649 RepID=UPI0025975036|nr:uncharacterized protein LOC130869009 isoform X2 [Chionomys nivalis]